MSLPQIPNVLAAEARVEITFDTAVNPSESGVNGRKSMRDQAIRNYTIAINPDDANEVMSIMLATRGARWPLTIRDYANNYKLDLEPQTWTPTTDGGTINLARTFTPATGTRIYSQRILVIDESEVSFQVFVNGSAAVSPISWSVTNPGGVLTVNGLVSGDIVTVSGEYLVPVVSSDRLSATIHHNDGTSSLIEVADLALTEILEDELTLLTA